MSCNNSLLFYANGNDEIKDSSTIDCNSILKVINDEKHETDPKKTQEPNLEINNLYGIRYLLYRYFKSAVVSNKKNLFNLVHDIFKILDDKIIINKYIGNDKFKQNNFLIFECKYNNIKILFIVDHNINTNIIYPKENSKDYNEKFFYHNTLILFSTGLKTNENDVLIKYIKKISNDSGNKNRIYLLTKKEKEQEKEQEEEQEEEKEGEEQEEEKEGEEQEGESNKDRIKKHQQPQKNKDLLEKIRKNNKKISIKKINSNYKEYEIEKKDIDLDNLKIIITEYYEGNYYDYLLSEKDDNNIFSSLIQIFISLINFYNEEANKKYLLSPENFFYKTIDKSLSNKYLLYKIDKIKCVLNAKTHLFVLFDQNLKKDGNNNNNALNSLMNILKCGFFSKYLYYGYNSFIVQLVQEINSNTYNIKNILEVFQNNISSFRILEE
jgi:hypothetical protein